jgi:hypothetical protein
MQSPCSLTPPKEDVTYVGVDAEDLHDARNCGVAGNYISNGEPLGTGWKIGILSHWEEKSFAEGGRREAAEPPEGGGHGMSRGCVTRSQREGRKERVTMKRENSLLLPSKVLPNIFTPVFSFVTGRKRSDSSGESGSRSETWSRRIFNFILKTKFKFSTELKDKIKYPKNNVQYLNIINIKL